MGNLDKTESAKSWKLSQGILSWVFFSTLFACSYSEKASRRLLEAAANNPYDLIIVPGVPFEKNKWGRTMKGRVYWSKYLYDRGIGKNIMYSGNAVYTPYFEGEIMALYAKAIGIPPEHIYTELKAEHSTENIYYSYQKAKKLGFDRIALASDPFQSKLLEGFVRKKINPEIGILPMVIDTLNMMDPDMIDPEIDFREAYDPDFVSLTKRENIWKRFQGTRGKNIDTSAYR
jgi:uncharacterized SAM-binding protein YcdF (DUF218 family)